MTTLVAPRVPTATVPVDGSRTRKDAVVRYASVLVLWSSLLLVTYWWAAGGGIQDLAGVDRRSDLDRPADRSVRVDAAAGPGAADGAAPGAGARVRPGPAGPDPPAGRLHLVQPDARPHRADHLRLRRRPTVGGTPGHAVGPDHRLPAACCWPSPARPAWSWSWSPASGPPAAGCATSPGTCCTSTPTSASGSPCRTSCGPGRSSSPPPRRDRLLVDALGRHGRGGAGLAGRAAAVAQPPARPAGRPRWSPKAAASCRST